jgi:branched-subunit amino acid ABC-type transport system permease component
MTARRRSAFGIDVDRVYAGVFALGAALAAIAAVLIVPIQQAHYLMGGDPLLLSFIVVIIGGLGSLRGTLVAALLIGVSDGIISVFFSPTLAKILATLLVALVLVFRPQGLFGTAGDERRDGRAVALHLGVLAVLFAAAIVLPAYHHANLARIMVLAVFAMGYNIAFGYAGLLSLGHALFFAAGSTRPGSGCTARAGRAAGLVAGMLAGGVARAGGGACWRCAPRASPS